MTGQPDINEGQVKQNQNWREITTKAGRRDHTRENKTVNSKPHQRYSV